ncbi:DUF4148 domain-containing protein [Paraburkholderia sp. IMGN_8]|uniref:DUF4148 domain-containing protein n=1 Tax=Paraburkholderia sp. IMGN_8 TaxID=3136564 RepID=UPI0031017974
MPPIPAIASRLNSWNGRDSLGETGSGAAMASDALGGTSVGGSASGAHLGKTRAAVYRELQRAQKDGTLDRLNSLHGGGN